MKKYYWTHCIRFKQYIDTLGRKTSGKQFPYRAQHKLNY